mgnify:CR=1 FL=1
MNFYYKIKYYQEDNLRLSNEVVILSNKLENTKQQLKQFEDNKIKLMHQMQNLNNIISENNIIDSPFGTSTQKNEYFWKIRYVSKQYPFEKKHYLFENKSMFHCKAL